MSALNLTLASLVCIGLISCQSGVGTPSNCLNTSVSCNAEGLPNTTSIPVTILENNDTNTSENTSANGSVANSSQNNSGTDEQGNVSDAGSNTSVLLPPENFRIVDRTSNSILVAWDRKETSPHTYRIYLNNQLLRQGITLPNFMITGLNANEDYDVMIEAVSPDGVSPKIELQTSSNTNTSTGTNTGSGGSGSGSSGSGSSGSGSSGSGSSGSGSSGSGSSGSGGSGSGGSGSGGSGSGGSGSGGSGSGGSGSGGSGSGGSGSGDSGSGDSGSENTSCPDGGLLSLCLDVGLDLR